MGGLGREGGREEGGDIESMRRVAGKALSEGVHTGRMMRRRWGKGRWKDRGCVQALNELRQAEGKLARADTTESRLCNQR